MRIILLCLFIAFSTAMHAQEREWKPKSFDSLAVESEIDLTEEQDEIEISKISSGYFPIPQYWGLTVGFMFQPSILRNSAVGIRPTGLVETNFPYTSNYGNEDEYLNYKEKFSEVDESEFSSDESIAIGLDFKFTPDISIPIELRASSAIAWNSGSLYSEDKTKSYLHYNNTPESYLEIGHILLEETLLEFSGGVNIPIYGVYTSGAVDFSTSYSLYLGANLNEVLSSEATQYLQIGKPKDKIRYENGLDTLHLLTEVELPTLVKSRLYYEVGFSTGLEADGYGMLMDIKYMVPTQSILKDDYWRQSQFRMNFIFYFGGVFR